MKSLLLTTGCVAMALQLATVNSWAKEGSKDKKTEPVVSQWPVDTGDLSVTVLPVMTRPEIAVVTRADGTSVDMSQRFAAGVAALLERAGIEEIELGETRFNPPDTDNMAQVAEELGTFIRTTPIKTQFAVYCEFHGTPKTGPVEIRTIVVDQQGKTILADRDDRATYGRTTEIRPKDPMTCCVFVAKKVQNLWQLADPLRSDAPEGKMAQYWRKQSGAPSKSEMAQMRRRREVLQRNVEPSNVTVYPIRVGSETDRPCAVQLAEMLTRDRLSKAVPSDVDPQLQIQGDPNEQKVLWDTARAIRRFVKEDPPSTDYALYADYGIGRSSSGEAHVGYVHVILCDRQGDWVIVDLQNSHHSDFQSIDPKSREDCNRLVVRRAQRLVSDR